VRLSARARYAVRLVLEVARRATGEDGQGPRVQLAEVSRSTRISRRFLEGIASGLSNCGILVGVCGRGGGYRLGRPPEAISMGAIIRAVEGPLSLAVCVEDPTLCLRADFCEGNLLWSLLQLELDAALDAFSVADLRDPLVVKAMRADVELLRRRHGTLSVRGAGHMPNVDPEPLDNQVLGRPEKPRLCRGEG